jgi:hypothetical protein
LLKIPNAEDFQKILCSEGAVFPDDSDETGDTVIQVSISGYLLASVFGSSRHIYTLKRSFSRETDLTF